MMTVALMLLAFVTGFLLGEWRAIGDGMRRDRLLGKKPPPPPPIPTDVVTWNDEAKKK